MEAYQKSKEEVFEELSVGLDGLSNEEALKRQEQYGLNKLEQKAGRSVFQKILAQFSDFLIIILIFAAIISGLMGETINAILILAIVIMNAIFGLVQEAKADKALEALAKMSSPKAKVIRNGNREFILSNKLVPGDIVVLETGDSIPADLRLVETTNLEIQEAALTGESVASSKNADFLGNEKTPLGDRKNMAYMSTIVTYGRGLGVVCGTGMKTEVGKIAESISTVDTSSTPLQRKLDTLGKRLGLLIIFISVFVFLLGLLRSDQAIIDLFMTAISLAVAAIPEGLPAVVTVVLALGMTRMSKKNAVIRKLLAVETLGTTTVICSDKTGTLTENQMTVVKVVLPNGEFEVTGVGYTPEGEFELTKGEASGLRELLTAASLCTDSELVKKKNRWDIIGDPTEGGLIVAASKAGLKKADLTAKYPRVLELPFDSERKKMSTLHAFEDNFRMCTKGAPDELLKLADKVLLNGDVVEMTEDIRAYFAKTNEALADEALRVLAIAIKDYDKKPEKLKVSDESSLVFLGLMAMIDPPRKEAKAAIEECLEAGIKPKMITGDYARTALAIGKQIGLADEEDRVLTGTELSAMSDKDLKEAVETVNIYARVSPEHKVRIVKALKENGHIVAMTGDGVNDAMALKHADIGVSMGITGTDVAKQTAEMVLMDDNFVTIVGAVEEGRIIYSNIRKFVYFLLSCNIAEVLVIFFAMLFGLPIPLSPIQLLWINVLTDAFPALALGMEPGEPGIMKQNPRSPKEPLIDRKLWGSIIVQALIIASATLFAFLIGMYSTPTPNVGLGRTMAFLTLILGELLRAFSTRSEQISIFKLGLVTNKPMIYSVLGSLALMIPVLFIPALNEAFGIVFLSASQWLTVIALGFLPFIGGEVHKLIIRQKAIKVS
ncbi:MAG: cation-translocating P-type ATPase [Firmicutes bacterium]|nr:cation-translocating P-type ATPase [Bacillota bacterium]MDD4693031.1 cation-translocating P-type ATPase [Bacillota bacterium]